MATRFLPGRDRLGLCCIAALLAVLLQTSAGMAQNEVYYDQFDWGEATGNPGDLNTGFWDGNRALFSYQPFEDMGTTHGAARFISDDSGVAMIATEQLGGLLSGTDVEIFARVRMTAYEAGAGERNAEIGFRNDGSSGFLLTIDGGADELRLRRQGGNYADLVTPVSHDVQVGDVYYMHASATGSDPVELRARIATTPDFAAANRLFDVTHTEADWLPNGTRLELIGYANNDTAYTFDFDYIAIGEPGFGHTEADFERGGFTDAPEMPTRAGNLKSWEIVDNTLVVHTTTGVDLRITPSVANAVRVGFAPEGSATQFDRWGVLGMPDPAIAPPDVTDDGDRLLASAQGMTVHIFKEPVRLMFWGDNGAPVLAESPDHRATATPGGGRTVGFLNFTSTRIYGLGGHSVSRDLPINRYGHSFPIRNAHEPPARFLYPFFHTPEGMGVFIDNPGFAQLDVGDSDPDVIEYAAEVGELEYYVFAGDSGKDVLRSYWDLTGRPAVPPRWTFGNVQSKFGYASFDEVQDIIDEFDTRDIPLDSVILDLYWFGQSTMGNLEFQDNGKWDDPADRLAGFRDQDVKIIPITEPHVTGLSFNASEVIDAGLVAREPDGTTPYALTTMGWVTNDAPVYLLDFTRAETRDWWRAKHEKLITEYLFDGWWQDLNEPEGAPGDALFAGGPLAAVGNVQALNMNRALVDAMAEFRPEARPFIMSRSGYAGMQRYGASVWSGDVRPRFSHLANQPSIGLSQGMAGVPYWNSDIGGFSGGTTAELYEQWCAFALFTPMYRPHAAHSDREPWAFGPEVEARLRDLLRWRYRLIPYYYTIAHEMWEPTGDSPWFRPVLWEFPEELDFAMPFMVGDALLARPEIEEDRTEISSYLPDGFWYDWFTGERLLGPAPVVWEPAERRYHLHARARTIVPLAPATNRSDAAPLDFVTWRVFLPAAPPKTFTTQVAEGRMVEDDGVSLAYTTGARRITEFTASWEGETIVVEAASISGSYAGEPATRTTEIEVFGMPDVPENVRVDATTFLDERATREAYESGGAGWWYDDERNVLMAKGDALGIDTLPWFSVEMPVAGGAVRIR